MTNRSALKSIAVQMNTIDSELAKLDEYRAEGKSLTSDDQDDAYRVVLLDEYRKLSVKKLAICRTMFLKESFLNRLVNKI